MSKLVVSTLLLSCITSTAGAAQISELPELPEGVSNNAITMRTTEQGHELFSFTGLLAGKSWRDVTDKAWWLPAGAEQWQALPPVPGGQGRLAAVAVTANQSIWLFGGYTVAEDGSEVSTPETFKVNPTGESVYQRMTDMPIPVDDVAAMVYQDRYIYLISGWHDVGNVNLVQVYDTQTDSWQQATPWPGLPVFGQSGGIAGNQMLVCGGVRIEYPSAGARDFLLTDACWLGVINANDSRRIQWRPVPPMPVSGRYRAAAAGLPDASGVVFIGGSDNPYNYNGIGYNDQPSAPLKSIISFDFASGQWQCRGDASIPSMDHRGLLLLPDGSSLRLGGMLTDQQVSGLALQQSIPEVVPCP